MNQEVRYKNAIIRVHIPGSDAEARANNIKNAATEFLKKVEFQKRKKE